MQRGRPSGTATSAVPSSGTSRQPSRRAARAGYSAVRSGEDVKIALSTSSGWNPFASWSARNSSAVASRIASRVLAAAVVAPRRDTLALARALVGALSVPVIVNDRVDVALAAGAAGAHLGQDDPPLDRLRPHLPHGFVLGISVGSPAEAARVGAWPADYWSVGPCFATGNKADAGTPLGPEGFAALARLAPGGLPVIAIGGITPANVGALAKAGAAGVAVIGAVWGGEANDPAAATRALRAAFA